MAVSSRSSLRLSARRREQSPPAAAKRQRIVAQSVSDQHHPQSSRHHRASSRRKSSPDLLDVTIEDTSDRPRQLPLRHASSPVVHPRAHPPFSTTPIANVATTSSPSSSLHRPDSCTPRNKGAHLQNLDRRRASTHATPSAIYLHNGRESPDPLDTISPLTTTKPHANRDRNHDSALHSSPVSALTRSTRRSAQHAGNDRDSERDSPDGGRRNPTTPAADTGDSASVKNTSSRAIVTSTSAAKGDQTPSLSASGGGPAVPERRSLRSHDAGARSKCELASYFSNYEQLLSLESPEPEFLAGDTTVQLIDDLAEPIRVPSPAIESPFGNPLLQIHGCEVVELPDPPQADDGEDAEDPLNEGIYFRAHRRFERQEKQLRNIERERAQHEKLQLDRILDELRGQDWLRTMGIGGISDGEKKLYEPKRNFFIKELSALVEKFKVWKEEEKRRKLEKEKMLLARLEAETHEAEQKHTSLDGPVLPDTASSRGESADASDVDIWAARQLHQEARTATASVGKRPKVTYSHKRRQEPTKDDYESPKPLPPPLAPPIPVPPEPQKPFVSFYSKPSLREAALSSRRKGRTRLAFGHPIPEMEEREFRLPDDILTPGAIQACRRKRRRMKRESRTG